MNQEQIKKGFHDEMVRIYEEEKELGHNAIRFRKMLNNKGGFQTATDLLSKPQPQIGFERLRDSKNFELTVEFLVLQEPWRQLFEQRYLDEAEKRLRDCGFDPYKSGNHEPC